MSKFYTMLALASSLCLGALPESRADTWNFAAPYSYQEFNTKIAEEFGRLVSEKTSGEISVTVHPGGSLFKHAEVKNAVRNGLATAGYFTLSILSNENPLFEVDSIPFLVRSYEDAERLWEITRPYYDELLAKQGLIILWATPQQPQAFWSVNELTQADSLNGASFRAYNATTERLARLLGAAPTTVELSDLAQAFGTGRISAMVTSPSGGASAKSWDFVSNFYDTQGWLPNIVGVMHKRTFDRLSDEQKEAVLAAASEADRFGRELSAEEEKRNKQQLVDNGMTIHEPTEAFMGALLAAGEELKKDWVALVGNEGAEIIKKYEERTK